MALDTEIKAQLQQYLTMLESDMIIRVHVGSDSTSYDMLELVNEIASMSTRINVEHAILERSPSFTIVRQGSDDSGVVFAGIPLGHEFTSFVLALLQVSGRAPKIDVSASEQIKSITGEYRFETYVSLTCHNCPDVVQALNVMSVLNPGISHTMIDGAVFQAEVEAKHVLAVPSIYLNGEFLGSGRMTLEEIIAKLDIDIDAKSVEKLNAKEPFDVLVVGGGPAGASAAIYTARKGIRTGIVAERFGGQVMDTMGIENFISVKHTEGPQMVAHLEEHVKQYQVDIMNLQRVVKLNKDDSWIQVELENGAVLKSRTVIVATGARWRNLGVHGEAKFKNKGVAYCPHCDGPLFKNKRVAVVGGGNSGIEAAIDLAGIVAHVTVLEFAPTLKADEVLQKRLYRLANVTVRTNVQTKEITGTDSVNGITYIERDTHIEQHIELEGVFIQIGLVPNTDWLKDSLELTKSGEIIVDQHGATELPGVFAAGDCTNNPYKQIIISMGSGATAALGAFDHLIRSS